MMEKKDRAAPVNVACAEETKKALTHT